MSAKKDLLADKHYIVIQRAGSELSSETTDVFDNLEDALDAAREDEENSYGDEDDCFYVAELKFIKRVRAPADDDVKEIPVVAADE